MYVPYTGKTGGYYQGRALIMREYYEFTLPYTYFVNLEDYKKELTTDPSNWSCSIGGDKNDQTLLGDTTIINRFPHTKGNAVCVLSTFCNALFWIGYQLEAMIFFDKHNTTLNQKNPNLWSRLTKYGPRYVSQIKLKRLSTPRCVTGSELFNTVTDEYILMVQITATDGDRSHWFCMWGGLIYDANFYPLY